MPIGDDDIERLPPEYYAADDYDREHGFDSPYDNAYGDVDDALLPEHDERRAPPAYLGDDGDEPPRGRGRGSRGGGRRGRGRRRRGKRFVGWLVALGIIAGLAAGAWFGARELLGINYDDYRGAGKDNVVVQVNDGDSTRAIAATLTEADVVASERAFLAAAEDSNDIRSIQPGYYVVKKQASGADAVRALLAEKARVGQMQIKSGTQLDDLEQPDGKETPGILSQLSRASCAELNGRSTCVEADELRDLAGSSKLTKFGVPESLARAAEKAPKERRLEGLIMPGIYDVKPGWNAERLLTEVLTVSATRLTEAGLDEATMPGGRTAYEVLVIASVIEREAVKNDFEKVSRVVYNRLAKNMRLQMDSTINYVLTRPHIRTSSKDRSEPGPYNSYLNTTLPPTPISAPSPEAVLAAQSPAEGKWLYFVKCEKSGLSCFTDDFDEHERNIKKAKQRGIW